MSEKGGTEHCIFLREMPKYLSFAGRRAYWLETRASVFLSLYILWGYLLWFYVLFLYQVPSLIFFFFETESHVAQASLQLAIKLNS